MPDLNSTVGHVLFDEYVSRKDNSFQSEKEDMNDTTSLNNQDREPPHDVRDAIGDPAFQAPSHDVHSNLPVTTPHSTEFNNESYPVDAFPPIMQNVIRALHEDTLFPVEIIGSAVLAASALACQSHIDVVSPRDNGHREPCTLFLLVLAERGKGKSPIYRKVMRSFYDFVEQMDRDYLEKRAIYDNEFEDWKERDDALKSLRKQAIKKGEDGESENKRRAQFKKPVPPRKFSIIFEDTTLKDMVEKLEQYPYAGIFSDEAGSFTKGYLKRNLEFLDKVWSGDAYSHSRSGESSLNIKSWISILLMVQPNIFRRFLENESNDALDIGFIDRLLISFTNSEDDNESENEDYSQSDNALDIFHKTILRFLVKQKSDFDNAIENKRTLFLSSKANIIRKEASKDIRSKPKNEKEWEHMGEFVQKAENNAIRIAAILTHMHNNESTVIDDVVISNAYRIVRWHLNQANEFLYLSSEKEQFKNDVRKAYLWLKDEFYENDHIPVMFNDLRRRAPKSLRNSHRLRLIFNQLVFQNIIVLAQINPNGALYTLPVLNVNNAPLEAPGIYYFLDLEGRHRLICRLLGFEGKYIPYRANPLIPRPRENDFFTIFYTSKNTRSESAEIDLSDLMNI